MTQIGKIAEYLSQNAITASPRFSFQPPAKVFDDLLQCYAHFVRASEREIRLTADTEKVLRSAANWLKTGKRGLLLYGNCGTGKSKLMQALSYLIAYYSNNQLNGLKVYSASELVKFSLSKDEKESATFDSLRRWRYVGIDDLGTEPVNVKNWGTDTSPVIDILYKRYDAMKVTVLSTNLNMDGIKEAYGERIHDRICEMYDRISFNFQSFRQK